MESKGLLRIDRRQLSHELANGDSIVLLGLRLEGVKTKAEIRLNPVSVEDVTAELVLGNDRIGLIQHEDDPRWYWDAEHRADQELVHDDSIRDRVTDLLRRYKVR